jgi:hypothetical protein
MSRCFYQSIPYYKHEVYKCQGGIGDSEHEKFYTEHFSKDGHKVLKTDKYLGDRIYSDGKPCIDGSLVFYEMKKLKEERPNSSLLKDYERQIFGEREEKEFYINGEYII